MNIPKDTTHFIHGKQDQVLLLREPKTSNGSWHTFTAGGWDYSHLPTKLIEMVAKPIEELKGKLAVQNQPTQIEMPEFFYSPDKGLTYLPCEILFESNQSLVLRNLDTLEEAMFGDRESAMLTTEPPSVHEIALKQLLAAMSQHDDGTWVIPEECAELVHRAMDVAHFNGG